MSSNPARTPAEPVSTPYGSVSLPMTVHQVSGAPVYYLVGRFAVPGPDNEGHTSNAGFVVTDAGVVVFDALGTPALGYRMLERIREITDQPIERVVVSHYHADHIYGLQAFKEHAGSPPVWAHELAAGYVHGAGAGQGEDAERRLAQRREALSPWVNETTYIVEPDHAFDDELRFAVGEQQFLLKHVGPGHSPDDSIMLVERHGVLFSGDVVYEGRLPFLNSPRVDSRRWLQNLDYLASLEPAPEWVIPGHGRAFTDPEQAARATRDYIAYLRAALREAVEDFLTFEEAYARTDWSAFEHIPAFEETNRGNAYRVFLDMEEAVMRGE